MSLAFPFLFHQCRTPGYGEARNIHRTRALGTNSTITTHNLWSKYILSPLYNQSKVADISSEFRIDASTRNYIKKKQYLQSMQNAFQLENALVWQGASVLLS